MLYELRVYEITPGRTKALHDRFINVTLGFFKKYGIKATLFLEPVIGTSNQLIYLLEWESLAEREQRWNAFQSDPEWLANRAETEKEWGPLTVRNTNTVLAEVPRLMAALRAQQ